MIPTDLSGDKSQICPKCHEPVQQGKKFCESCGAKIDAAPRCPHCDAPLLPNIKFCESCGKPVGTQEVPPVFGNVPSAVPAPPVPEPLPIMPVNSEEGVPALPGKTSGSRTRNLVIAGVVGLVVIAALAWFVVLPMLSGPGTASPGNSGSMFATGSPSPTSTVPGVPEQNIPSASLVTEPTQVPPVNLVVTYQAERDPITGLVTVTFTGGPGRYGQSDALVRLTRSDGQVLTKSFTPKQVGDTVTLQGTKATDRCEVIANFYNGAKYRIIDTLFEYKKRN
jgi:hypothetical protein